MATTIHLRNLKNIKSLDFEIPVQSGVYVITGLNGCGKTSLLVAIHRIANANAYKDNYLQATDGVDSYANSAITYRVGADQVTYRHRRSRWVPSPRSKSGLLSASGISNSRLISTSSYRFFLPEKNKIPSGAHVYRIVSPTIISGLNTILNTNKYDNLKFIQLQMRLGRRPAPYRSDKLYVIKNGNNVYSEYAFSLGERLLLNVLDYIDTVPINSVLMIDEIELALHPIAQTRFFDYLKNIANVKNLRVFLTTHSSSLIKHANKLYYLSDVAGDVSVIQDCTPAYILKDVSSDEEKNPDYILFVEDEMARFLLSGILHFSKVAQRKHRICKIVQVGGYHQVLDMTKQFYTIPPFNRLKICAFLDADVKDTISIIRAKGAAMSRDERELLNLSSTLTADLNLKYLNITPEIGVWEWIVADCSGYMGYLVEQYGEQMFNMQTLVDDVAVLPYTGENERKKGKSKLYNLANKVMERISYSNIELAYKDMMYAYAKYCMSDPNISRDYIQKLEAVLNR